jgi:hypothetical protein
MKKLLYLEQLWYNKVDISDERATQDTQYHDNDYRT